jgi:hypothetical protein
MTRPLLLSAALVALAAPAQAQAPPKIDADTQLFCQGDDGEIRAMNYFKLGDVIRRYQTRFNFEFSVQGPPLRLVFANPAQTPYSVTYKAQEYTDTAGRHGIAITSMHLFLDNADRDIVGTPMCYFTEFGK